MVLLQAPCVATVSVLGLFFRVFMEKEPQTKTKIYHI